MKNDDIVSHALQKLRIFLVLPLALALAAAAQAAPRVVPLGANITMPRPAVVVLWASWCASCRAELARVARIADAARPLPVVTVALDSVAVARARVLADGRTLNDAFADTRPPATALADWGGAGAALPLTVAIDRLGRICGRKRGLLGTDQLRDWAQRCSR